MTTRSLGYPVLTKVESRPSIRAIMATRMATVSPIPKAVIRVPTRRTQRLLKLYRMGIFI